MILRHGEEIDIVLPSEDGINYCTAHICHSDFHLDQIQGITDNSTVSNNNNNDGKKRTRKNRKQSRTYKNISHHNLTKKIRRNSINIIQQ